MTVRFLHAADIHLGNRQYGRQERQDDFARSFRNMVQAAIDAQVDFFLVAGDLFHKRTVEARTFVQTAGLLALLKERGIPVLAVEGNHERPYFTEGFSWLDGLAELGLARVLSGEYAEGVLTLNPYDEQRRRGAYVDIKGVRIFGQRYFGASTPRVIADLTVALEALRVRDSAPCPGYAVMMLHAGLDGILDQYAGTVSRSVLDGLRPYVDYVALGHIHKPYTQDDWLYNPGSLENNSADEVQWEDRGYYLVEVEPGPPVRHRATLHRSTRRAYLRHQFSVDAYETPDALLGALARDLERLPATGDQPILELRLNGVLNFGRQDLDLAHIQQIAEERVKPLLCQVQDQTRTNAFEIRTDEEMSRQELEHSVLMEIVQNDVRRRPHAERWAGAALRIKQMALAHTHPQDIIGELEALLEAVSNGTPQEQA
ncbi:MAG: metallophosphoesterase family protein [Anaerolineae bacterium]